LGLFALFFSQGSYLFLLALLLVPAKINTIFIWNYRTDAFCSVTSLHYVFIRHLCLSEGMNNAVILPDGSGVRLPLGTRVPKNKHARKGGNPYSPKMRGQVLFMWLNGGGANGGGNAALRLPAVVQL
jgi:hypothetical protein